MLPVEGLSTSMRGRHRPALILATVCAALTTITTNLSVLNIGLPTLARQLGASNSGLEWIVDAYALVFAGFLLAAGSLGDRVGRKRVMITGLAIFAVSSALAALTHTSGQLIAARGVMGLGAAFIMPMTLSILTDVYPSEAGLRRAIGVWAATASAGAVVAPVLAGVLLSAFWWGSLFLINVPLALLTLLATAVLVPESAPRRDGTLDWPGVCLSIVFSAGLVFALIEGPDLGWSDPVVVSTLVLTVVALAAFCFLELRSPDPLIDIRCFRIRGFSVGSGVVALQYFIGFGVGFLVTQYMQLVLGLSPLRAGLAVAPSALVVMFSAPIGVRAFGRFGARVVTTTGLLIAAAGAFSMSLVGVNSPVGFIIGSLVLLNLSIGLMAPGTTSMVMSSVPPERAGMASGTQSTTRQLGGALGVAVLGSILAARYSSQLAHAVGTTQAVRYLPQARRSLAEALGAAPPGSAVERILAHLAKEAFVNGMHIATTLTAIIATVSAVSVFVALRPGAPAVTGMASSPERDGSTLGGGSDAPRPAHDALSERPAQA
jgi:EmrB/QacA subfamily drug resistance transporter